MKWIHTYMPMLFIAASFAYGGSIHGIVRDGQSLNPIADVHITVGSITFIPPIDSVGLSTTTDQNGMYSITGIIPGAEIYAVSMNKDGYVNSFTVIDSLGLLDMVYDVDLFQVLAPEPPTPPNPNDSSIVFGTIMTLSLGNGSLVPVVNAQVRFTSGIQQLDVLTNSEGKYTTDIPLGMYSIVVSADGYTNLTITGIQVEKVGATVNAILQSASTEVLTDQGQSKPNRFTLLNAYPNPFNPSTTIAYELKEAGFVSMRVYDLAGRDVATLVNGVENAGYKWVTFKANNLASGIYLYRLQAGCYSETKKFLLLK